MKPTVLVIGATGQRRPDSPAAKGLHYAIMLEWCERVGYNADISGLEREFGVRPTTFADWARGNVQHT